MKTVTSDEMRKIDNEASEAFSIPGIILMENAGRSLADFAVSLADEFTTNFRKFYIFCGSGNNGGDGLTAGRHLYNRGFQVEIFILRPAEEFKGDALANFNMVKNLGIEISLLNMDFIVPKDGIIIDAILGIGTTREITGLYRTVIEKINSSGLKVISADIPSGMNADTGEVLGVAIRADATVTMGLVKKALVAKNISNLTGKLLVADIGLPIQLLL